MITPEPAALPYWILLLGAYFTTVVPIVVVASFIISGITLAIKRSPILYRCFAFALLAIGVFNMTVTIFSLYYLRYNWLGTAFYFKAFLIILAPFCILISLLISKQHKKLNQFN